MRLVEGENLDLRGYLLQVEGLIALQRRIGSGLELASREPLLIG